MQHLDLQRIIKRELRKPDMIVSSKLRIFFIGLITSKKTYKRNIVLFFNREDTEIILIPFEQKRKRHYVVHPNNEILNSCHREFHLCIFL